MGAFLRRMAAVSRTVDFCDRCGTVCDTGCRARQRRERQQQAALEALAGVR